MSELRNDAKKIAEELIEKSGLKSGNILVIGCSTSEVAGQKIGTYSNKELAEQMFDGIYEAAAEHGVFIAAQCCEHLNRAIIIERELMERLGLDEVNVVPQPKAGGSFATTAYERFSSPAAVEHIRADAGLDIGGTLIGMHLKEVAVPLRLSEKTLGEANILCARTRPKFIGGGRAHYDESKM